MWNLRFFGAEVWLNAPNPQEIRYFEAYSPFVFFSPPAILNKFQIKQEEQIMAKKAANSKFMAPVTPSEKLAAIVGSKPIPRTEITKKLWAYIKKNNLQDKKNRRMINADEKLRPIFKKDQVSMFDMTKLVAKQVS